MASEPPADHLSVGAGQTKDSLLQSPSRATRKVCFNIEGHEDYEEVVPCATSKKRAGSALKPPRPLGPSEADNFASASLDSLPSYTAEHLGSRSQDSLPSISGRRGAGSPLKQSRQRGLLEADNLGGSRSLDSLQSYSGGSPRQVRQSARWDSERQDVAGEESRRVGWESEASAISPCQGMSHVFTTVSYNAPSECNGFESISRSIGGSSSSSNSIRRLWAKARGAAAESAAAEVSPSKEGGGEPLGDRGVALVINTFKNLKQSVIEVIRIEDLRVRFSGGSSPGKVWAVVEACGRRRHSCLSWCRAPRTEVFGSFSVTLHAIHDDADTIGSADGFSHDIRITRHARVRGNAALDVRVYGDDPQNPENSRRLANMLARYSLSIPPVLEDDGVDLECEFVERSSFRRSGTTLSNIGSRSLSGKSWASEGSHVSAQLFEGSSCTATIKMLDSSKVFDILRCKPKGNAISGRSEWSLSSRSQLHKIWNSPWTDRCLVSQRRCIAAMMAEMKSDIVIFYQTLFAQSTGNPPPAPQMSEEELEAHTLRILFLKRLVLCLAANRVSFCCEENGTARRQWPFPLVSALCHGSRILIRLDGVDWKAFVNFLMFGDEEAHNWGSDSGDVPSPLYKRLAATHAVGLHQTGRLYERKLNMSNTIKNIKDGITSHHLGMDLPLGGLGNKVPMRHGRGTLFVGPSGVPFRRLKGQNPGHKYLTDMQHGHLYLRWDDFPAATMPVIVSEHVQKDGEEEGTLMDTRMTEGTNEEETWFHLPAFQSVQDFQQHLEGAGYAPRGPGAVSRFFKLLDKDGELTMHGNSAGVLRSRGILIHLVFEQEEDDGTKVLLHQEANASLDDESPDITVPDPRVAMTLRRRGELVDDAVARLCQVQLQLGVAAVDKVVEHCKVLMSGGLGTLSEASRAGTPGLIARSSKRESDPEMFIYKTKPPPSLCYHHGCCRECGVRVEYIAYRFSFPIRKQDRQLFHAVLSPEFHTRERADSMIGFGCLDGVTGLGGSSSSSPGRITRKWSWTTWEEAHRLKALGLEPPSQRMRVLHETGRLSALLIGIENSAPLKEDYFGGKHSAAAVSKEHSAFGTRKWRQYRKGGQEVPADIGGMHLEINAEYFNILKEMCRQCPLRRPEPPGPTELEANEEEKALFRKLLAGNDDSIQEVLSEFFQVTWPTHYQKAATQVLDCSIRERAASSSRVVTPHNSMPMTTKTPSSSSALSEAQRPSQSAQGGAAAHKGRRQLSKRPLDYARMGDAEEQREASSDLAAEAEQRSESELEPPACLLFQDALLPRSSSPDSDDEPQLLCDGEKPQAEDGQMWLVNNNVFTSCLRPAGIC